MRSIVFFCIISSALVPNANAMQAPRDGRSSTAWGWVATAASAAVGLLRAATNTPQPETQAGRTQADPHLDRDEVVITRVLGTRETLIIGENEGWIHSWVRRFAPYLAHDLTLEDGTLIPLNGGDCLVVLELNDLEPTPHLERFHYLPASLLRKLATQGSLKLKYRNRIVKLVASRTIAPVLLAAVDAIERSYHDFSGGEAFEPNLPGERRKRYKHPEQAQTEEESRIQNAMLKANLERADARLASSKRARPEAEPSKERRQYHFGDDGFAEVADTDVVSEIHEVEEEIRVGKVRARPNALVIDAVGLADLTLTFFGNHLLVHLRQRAILEIGLTADEYFAQMPRHGATYINLDDYGISREAVEKNLKRARYDKGVLVLFTDAE